MSIKIAIGVCSVCQSGLSVPIVGKREDALCTYHYNLKNRKKYREKAKLRQIKTKFLVKPADSDLVEWYRIKMVTSVPICENCGTHIPARCEKTWHGCQAHILPKSLFPSVKTHPDNHMVLSWYGCSCHGQYDSSWLNASRMNIFPVAVERFYKFYDAIDPAERKKIPEQFLR